jgi:5'-3' exonuclease
LAYPVDSEPTEHGKLNNPETPTAWLIDASIYIFRAWYTLPDSLTDRDGHPVNAVYGFMEFVWSLLWNERPEQIGFAFDQSLEHAWRKEIYPAYKANREPAPEELKRQFRYCREFIDALGIRHAASRFHEADDIIGTWATQARSHGQKIHIITGDKDLAQLISRHDLWWEYGKNIRRTATDIEKKFGVRPDQMADVLAIAGDSADNIPGVPGIGMITAAKLLKKFDCIDNLLSRTPEIGRSKLRGAKRLQHLIEAHRDTILLSRRLTGIVCDIDEADVVRPLQRDSVNREKLEGLLHHLSLPQPRIEAWMGLADR